MTTYTSEMLCQSSASSYRKVRGWVNSWISSSSESSVVIGWSIGADFQNAYHYGALVKCYVNGSQVGSTSGMLNSDPNDTWTTACSTSGTTTISRTHSSQSIPIKVTIENVTIDGYGSSGSFSGSTTEYQSVSAKSSYTVSFNANGGSGAPSSQTKWYGETLTLSSTTPTRTGYKFLGWSTSNTATSAAYSAGGSYTDNSAATLYAVWQEYALTVNYYSNYATGVSADPLNAVGSTKNVLVKTGTFYYDNDYSTYGLVNYTSTSNSFYLTRTGYTGTGYWGTTTSGGTLVNQNTGFATGQKLAEAFGKSLESGNASVNIYAQWRENYLTVNYYSNYADYINTEETVLNDIGADKNVAVHKYDFKYATSYPYGLANYSEPDSSLCMTRTRYDATGYWCTTTAEDVKLEGDKTGILSYTQEDGTTGIAIGENETFASGQAVAEALGLSLESGDKSINLYANWVLLCSRINLYLEDGSVAKGMVHIYDENGDVHYGILYVYGDDCTPHEVI